MLANNTKRLWIAVISLLLMVIISMILSPYWAVYRMYHAYQQHDSETLIGYIDFNSLQQGIQSQLTLVLVTKLDHITQQSWLRALPLNVDSAGMISPIVKQTVEHAITPNSVRLLINGQAAHNGDIKRLAGLIGVAMDNIGINELINAYTSHELDQLLRAQQRRDTTNHTHFASPLITTSKSLGAARYCGMNCFQVKTTIQGYPVLIELTRKRSFTWQVTNIHLPINPV